MKKNLFLLVAFLLIGISAQAQLKFGLKAGVNLSKASIEGSFGETIATNLVVENLTGFQVGPMVEFTVPILGIGFDAAALYSQEGFKLKGVEKAYKTNNLLVPVNLKYKLTFLNVVGAYVAAGPYAKFNFDDIKSQYESKSFGAGLNFGFGVELLGHLQVGVNYQLGLTEDFSSIKLPGITEIPNISNDLKGKPQGWTVSAAYLF
ncbi:membrane protein [Bacteroidia bacterium]|nr:membrane protein [Bacteroidia bacterium]GHT46717.1 membrane protein [Bacteroidia bacterium]